jgi:hypothetical protein
MVKVLRECSICNQLIEGRWIDHYLKYHNPSHDPEVRKKRSLALKGRIVSEETRRKLSERMKERYRRGEMPWNKGKPRTEEEKRAISEGTKRAMANLPPEKWEEIKLKISRAEKGKHKPANFGEKVRRGFIEHDQWIKEEMTRLTEQGYRCLNVGSSEAKVPDIIAFKDGKIYAIEITRFAVDHDKWAGQTFFDDIIWIVRRTSEMRRR